VAVFAGPAQEVTDLVGGRSAGQPPEGECSIERVLLREYAEELFDDSRFRRGSALSPQPVDEHSVTRLLECIRNHRVELLYTGISVNLLTLRPEICTVLIAHDHSWLDEEVRAAERAGRPFKLGWEYLDIVDSVDSVEFHRRQPLLELDRGLEPAEPRSAVNPGVLVPNAAAAILLAFRVLRDIS
jgi:hypothetical protein